MEENKAFQAFLKTTKKDLKQTDQEELNFLTRLNPIDYLFALNLLFLRTHEKIPEIGMDYNPTFVYYRRRRYDFLNLLNKKYEKYLTDNDKRKLKKLEEKYFYLNCGFYSIAFLIAYFKLFRSRIVNYYFALYVFYSAPVWALHFIKDDFLPIKNKVEENKSLNKRVIDILDETMIPDWRTYLYWYRLL
jgi:hypothetical protein